MNESKWLSLKEAPTHQNMIILLRSPPSLKPQPANNGELRQSCARWYFPPGNKILVLLRSGGCGLCSGTLTPFPNIPAQPVYRNFHELSTAASLFARIFRNSAAAAPSRSSLATE